MTKVVLYMSMSVDGLMPLRLENPTTIVPGDRVTRLVYDVSR